MNLLLLIFPQFGSIICKLELFEYKIIIQIIALAKFVSYFSSFFKDDTT